MTPLQRTRRKKFLLLKKSIAQQLGGRKRFTKLFPNPKDRCRLYDAVLFERNIIEGNQNKNIYNKYKNFMVC